MKRIISVSVLIFVLICAVTGCVMNTSTDGKLYNLYFANQQKNDLVVEQRNIDERGLERTARAVMAELIKGPATGDSHGVIPPKTVLIDLDIKDSVALVNFSKDYFPENDDTKIQELLARYSVVNTLCDIEGIDKVKIFIEGTELVNSSNVPVGALGKEDIMLNSTSSESAKTVSVILYYPDKNLINLKEELRTVSMVDNSLEKTIVHELLKGPEGEDLMSTIPAETKVLSVETKDGICFVNLSSEFITKHGHGSTAEAFTVYSIVNSLTELATVDSVQFLVEGKKAEVIKHMLLDSPYKRNEEYIHK